MAQGPPDEQTANEDSKTHMSDDKSSVKSRHINGTSDSDAQALVIASLRGQIQDLYSQVTQLNNKLVKSYDRVSDLEDDLHVASATARSSTLRISQLELERTQHLSALNTGLLVEKSQVTSELTRLMEKATEEAAQRGQAESARAAIEKDLDDLSASLFDQANTMVAEARYARAMSEQKVTTAEQALKGAEEAVAMMQQQMQVLQADKEASEQQMKDMQVTMGKGKWSERQFGGDLVHSTRLLSPHAPYQEFLLFVAHLRSVHPASPQPPAMTTLLPLPFIARLMTEDSDPTLRLDIAPSLNWLSRRSVLAAIHGGQLTIEPIPTTALLQESQSTSSNIPGLGNNSIVCALCGVSIFPSLQAPTSQSRLPSIPLSLPTLPNSNTSWSTSIFKRPLNGSANPSPPPSPGIKGQHTTTRGGTDGRIDTDNLPSQVHIFRISGPVTSALPSVRPIAQAVTSTSTSASSSSALPSQPPQHPVNHPTHQSTPSQSSSSTIYPLCHSGWCLARLRATCSMWAFVRTGIVEKDKDKDRDKVQATPPRRRGLWGMATALGERAASWGGEKDKEKGPATPTKTPTWDGTATRMVPPPPPPPPPPIAILPTEGEGETMETVFTASPAGTPPPPPPPLPRRNEGREPPPLPARGGGRDSPAPAPVPPPLPARNEGREGRESPAPGSVPSSPVAPPPLPKRSEGRRPGRNSLIVIKALDLDDGETQVDPARIALPDSRPGTPTLVPPVRGGSPAPGAGVGGVPPPLPRRAMARGPRPVPPSPAGPRAITPNGGSDVERDDEKVKAREGKTEEGSAQERGKEKETEEEKKLEQEKELEKERRRRQRRRRRGQKRRQRRSRRMVLLLPLEKLGELGDAEVRADEIVAVDGDADAKQESNPESAVSPEKSSTAVDTEKEVKHEKEETNATTTTAIATALSSDQAESGLEQGQATTGNDAMETHDKPLPTVKDDEKDQDIDTQKEKEKDMTMYVGDATWEERTWKEIVRLKEVMFWARIGGAQD
ncbi:hypothetical protein AAF712_004804 [Marasmius tenuissimus]|uniref:GDP/GTP exchange factor Sec2 N-terminal domain-containing protein n=1 Tax=Marasmius tenuissimus TaxID=585030 RepID=A0ABR3A494_9AGAR